MVGHISTGAKAENEKSIKVLNALWSSLGNTGALPQGIPEQLRLRFHVLDEEAKDLKTVSASLRFPPQGRQMEPQLMEERLMRALSPVFAQAGIEIETRASEDEEDTEGSGVTFQFNPWDIELYVDEHDSKRRMISKLFRKHRVRIRSSSKEFSEVEIAEVVARLDVLLQHALPVKYLAAFHSPVGQDLVICIGGEYYSRLGRAIVLPDFFTEEEAAEHIVRCVDAIRAETEGWL